MSEATGSGDALAGRGVWIEKCRPQTFDDVYGQDDIIKRLRSYIGYNDLPHLLFTGSTSVDKTTSATAIVRTICDDDWHDNFLELNASDEHGIDVIRGRVKNSARSSFDDHDYRVIFLDEADSLANDAQPMLCRTVKQFSDNTRSILSCNYSSKITDPIQSRRTVFRFSPLGDDAIAEQVHDITTAGDIEVTEDSLDALVYAAGGDMRRTISSLRIAATTGEVVDEEAVYMIASTARPGDIEEMIRIAIDGEFAAARGQLEALIVDAGMADGDVIDQLHRSIWESDLDEHDAVRPMERIGEADYRISEGVNEQVRLEALLASLALSQN